MDERLMYFLTDRPRELLQKYFFFIYDNIACGVGANDMSEYIESSSGRI